MKALLGVLTALLLTACGLEAVPVRAGDAGATAIAVGGEQDAAADAGAMGDLDAASEDAGDVQHGVWTGTSNVCGVCDDAGCVDVPCDAGGD